MMEVQGQMGSCPEGFVMLQFVAERGQGEWCMLGVGWNIRRT